MTLPNWTQTTIGQIGAVIGGGTPRTSDPENYDGDIFWLTPKDLSDQPRKYVSDTARTITQRGLDSSSAKLLPKGTVLLSSRAPIGLVSIAANQLTTNQGFRSIVPKSNVSSSFLYYALAYLKPLLESYASGTTFPEISGGNLKLVPMSLPPLFEQRAIAHVLGTLDDKIELNHKMNKTLEELARAIFKSWFVNFDPVKAKAEGRQPVGMDAETAALFADSFEDSEMGRIPSGWKMSSLEVEFDITMGQSPPGSSYNEAGDGVPFFQGRRDFGTRFPSLRVYCTDPRRFANENDTLLSVRAPVGDINMADRKCCIGRGLASVRHKSGAVSYTFGVVQQLKQRLSVFEGEGTVFGSINRKDLGAMTLCAPPESVLDTFETSYGSLNDLVRRNTEESRTLVELRDTLLPRLISGELRIPDAEKLLAEAPV
jgi:type I restriction enzyme, S subunit